MSTCLKCQKLYYPKRQGGFFCSVSCGNSYRQQQKRTVQKQRIPVKEGPTRSTFNEREARLWKLIGELGEQAAQLLRERILPKEQRPEDMTERLVALLIRCQQASENKQDPEITIQ